MRKRYIVMDNRGDFAVKGCWTHRGATRWSTRQQGQGSFLYVEYIVP